MRRPDRDFAARAALDEGVETAIARQSRLLLERAAGAKDAASRVRAQPERPSVRPPVRPIPGIEADRPMRGSQ